MILFKFNRNQTITKNYFFEGEEGGKKRTPNSKFYHNVLLRVSEANEVPISSHISVGLSTFNSL